MALIEAFRGVLPAMQVPFKPDYSLDEAELRRYTAWLAGFEGIGGLVTNGHTGEVFALSAQERAEVTRIVADAVQDKIPVVSGVNCENIPEAVEHAGMAKEAGAKGLLVMPPHIWLRFGMRSGHVVKYFAAIGEAVNINLVVHIYPAWTKASYSSALLAELAKLRAADPDCTILSCHDEYLLPTLVQGVDGALVGFASLIPDFITDLYQAVCDGDLKKAQAIQGKINILKEIVYSTGEPSSDAHARMKVAMNLSGRMNSNTVRPPTELPTGETYDAIVAAVKEVGLMA
jgi:4-hydroxy-tetrahydrodipicolinate synthase